MVCKLPDIVIKSLSFQGFFYYQIGFKTFKLILDNSNHTCAKLINILLGFFYMKKSSISFFKQLNKYYRRIP